MDKVPSHYFPPSAWDFTREIEQLKSQTEGLQNSFGQLLEQMETAVRGHAELAEQTQALSASAQEASAQILGRMETTAHSQTEQAKQTQTLLASAQEFSAQRFESMTEQLRQIGQQCAELDAKANAIIDGISGLYRREIPVDVRFERMYYKHFSVETSPEAPDFQTDCLALLAGLDEESVETVVLALQRLKLIKSSGEPLIELYSSKEKEIMRDLGEHFYSNILEISESCYFYRGYMLPVNHFEPCVFADKLMVPELDHQERLADRDIIDAGAFIGDSALILSPLTKKDVYAFEPTPANFALLEKTVAMNALTNVELCAAALGAEAGTAQLSIGDASSCSTQFQNEAVQYLDTVDVPVVKLDDFVREHDLHVGLIKADVEGAEQLLLRGAMETIKTQKPALLISIYHNARDYFGIKPWLESLDLGYRFKIRHSVGGTVMTETVLIAEVP